MEENNATQEQLNELMREMRVRMLQLDATVVKTPWMVRAIFLFLPRIGIALSAIIGIGYLTGDEYSEWWYSPACFMVLFFNYIMLKNVKKYDRISDDSLEKIEKQLNLFKRVGAPLTLMTLPALFNFEISFDVIGDVWRLLMAGLGVPFLELLVQYPILKSERKRILILRDKIAMVK